MRLEDLVFVTSNLDKLREAQQVLGTSLTHRALDLDEIQSLDLEEVVRRKAGVAFQRLRVPVLVEDTSLELAALGGFPGPLVRWLLASVGPEGICRMVAAFGDLRATARCIACASDGTREEIGIGVVEGRISASPRGSRGFGWDCAFVPDEGDGRTFAEMEAAEKNVISHRRRAFEGLRDRLGPPC